MGGLDVVDESDGFDVVVNGLQRRVAAGSSVADVVAELVPSAVPGRGTAVALSGRVVPAGSWTATPVAAGDRIEVVQAVAGG